MEGVLTLPPVISLDSHLPCNLFVLRAFFNLTQIELYLEQCDSIPAFLSSLTLEWFEQQTAVPR